MGNNNSFGITKSIIPNVTPSELVFFDTSDPNTGGTVFDPNTPAQADTLYVSSVDASTWIYSGGSYVSYTAPATASTPFYLRNTTIDAGSNKTSPIQRYNTIWIRSSLVSNDYYSVHDFFGISALQPNYAKTDLTIVASDSYSAPEDRRNRYRGSVSSPIENLNGDVIAFDNYSSNNSEVIYDSVIATENHTAGVSTGVKRIFQTTKNGSATLEDRLEFTSDGHVKLNGAYKMPNVDGTADQVLKTDGAGNVTWQSGGSSGVFGISDSSGVYTYYDTLTLAMASAVSGDTIEMFADVEETGDVTITLKDGVKINGNGHTYTLNVDSTANNLLIPISVNCEIFNLKLVRTGRTTGTTSGYCIYSNDVNPIVKFNGVYCVNDFGRGVVARCTLIGLNVVAYLDAIYTANSINLYNSYGESTSSGVGIYNATGITENCYGKSVSGGGISCNGRVSNCIGVSVSGHGILSNNAYNSTGISTSSYGLNGGEYRNCVGISTSSYAGYGAMDNCYLYSSSGVCLYSFFANGLVSNTTIIANGNVAVTGRFTNFKNCNIESRWNNAGGHAIGGTVGVSTANILGCNLKVANTSAYCIKGVAGSTFKMANNSFEGSTTPIDTTTVTQGITNTSDSQGNILI